MYDLIVVGGGTGGMPVALAAAEQGARVLLVEKTGRLGGQMWISTLHVSAAGAAPQRARGIVDSPDLHYADVMRLGRDAASPAVLRRAVDEAATMVEWLYALGVPYDADQPVQPEGHHESYSVPRTYIPPRDGPSWGAERRFVGAFVDAIEASTVEVRLNTQVTGLIVEGDQVVGVRVATHGLADNARTAAHGPADAGPASDEASRDPAEANRTSDEVGRGTVTDNQAGEEIRARDVILATGGYGANRDLVARFNPQYAPCITACLPHSTGDGIALAESVGGTTSHTAFFIPYIGGVEDPDRPGFLLDWALVQFFRPPPVTGDIWVNAHGERFVAEDALDHPDILERALMDQPGFALWAIWDGHAPTAPESRWTSAVEQHPRVEEIIRRADTIAELADRLGLPAETLDRTVRAYNAAVAAGSDPIGRTALPFPLDQPPYYGVRTVGTSFITMGGVRVDGDLRVIDAEGWPIPGLYAIGELLGAAQVGGDAFTSGMSAGPAITFGRWLGRRLGAA